MSNIYTSRQTLSDIYTIVDKEEKYIICETL